MRQTARRAAFEEAFGRSLVAALLQEDVEFDAVLVDRAPQHIRLAAQCHEHLVKMPGAARLVPRSLGAMCEAGAELIGPPADRFMADDDATLEQQFLDVAQAELEAKVPRERRG
ncbi:hypothetical protein B0G69_6605 [Paraburkholderia sp. RAU2J]|nr:hypothetical protein B0G69_6605 [Paraburkholderia sp. RAU2J]